MVAMALLAVPASAQATTASWTGTTSSDWATASNWSCACVPGSGDTVNISGGTGNPVVSTAGEHIAIVNIGAGKSLSVSGLGASLTNDNGLIDVAAGGSLTVGGGGTLILQDGAHIDDAGPTTIASGGLLKHQGSATGNVNDPLTVDGTVLENGGGLNLRGANVTDHLAGTLQTTGGFIQLGDKGDGQDPTTFVLDGTSTFDSSGGGAIRENAADVTIDLNGRTLSVDGDFTHNAGTLTGAGLLGGPGALHLTGGNLGSAGTLTVGPGATLSVESPTAGTGTRSIANNGRIALKTTNTLTVPNGYMQGSGGVLAIATAGPGSSGRLTVGGNVALGGTLEMNPTATYAAGATLGDSIDVIGYSAGTQTGSFCAITSVPALAGGMKFTADYDHSGNKVSAAVSSTGIPDTCNPLPPPTFTATSPPSPDADNHPFIIGDAATGSTVQLYTTADCSGPLAASGSAASFATPGLQVTVPDDSTTTFHGTATIGSTTSTCSTSSITYVHKKADGVPANTSPPQITGTPEVGHVLSCSQGTWTNNPTSFSYKWNRDGTAIAGATSSDYTALSADSGHGLTCTVTAGNAAGTASATSAAVTVTGPTTKPPLATAGPTVVLGAPGAPLSCTQGTWINGPTRFAYRWSRDAAAIGGASSAVYQPTTADVGHALTCTVVASNAAGGSGRTSAPLAMPSQQAPPACREVRTTFGAGGVTATVPIYMGCQSLQAVEAFARCLPSQNGRGYSATPYPAGTFLGSGFASPPPTPRPPPGVGQVPRGGVATQACLISYEVIMGPAGKGKASARVTLRAKGLTGGAGGCGALSLTRSGRAQKVLERSRSVTLHSTTTVRDASGNKTVTHQTSTARRSAKGRGCPSAPALTNFNLSRSKFHAAARGVSITKFPKTGPTVSYKDTQPADTTWTVDRVVRGIVKGHKCVVAPKRIHGKPRRCTGYQPVAAFIHHDRRGRNRFHFNGNVGGTKLRAGKYFLVAIASRHHTSGRSVSVPFRISR